MTVPRIPAVPSARDRRREVRRRTRRRVNVRLIATPTADLLHEAPDHAEAIAALFPRPHQAYWDLPIDRRRLLHLALDQSPPSDGPAARIMADDFLYRPTASLIADYLPDAPEGLATALRNTDDAPWTRGDYANLIGLLVHGGRGAALLPHIKPLGPQTSRVITAVPEEFRSPRILALLPNQGVALAFGALVAALARTTFVDAEALRQRLSRASSMRRVYTMLSEELDREPIELPLHLEPRLTRPVSVLELARTSVLLKNCLKGEPYVGRFKAGTHIYLQWNGKEPAAIELRRDRPTGWRLVHFAGVGNKPLTQEAASELLGALRRLGVRSSEPHPHGYLLELRRTLRAQETPVGAAA